MTYLPMNANSVPLALLEPGDTSGKSRPLRRPSSLKEGAAVLHDQKFHSVHLSVATAASIGFATNSLEGSAEHRVSIIEWKRFMEKSRSTGETEYWGISVRYAVEYRAIDIKGEFSVTALAANAELSNTSATIDFSTRGIDSAKLVTPIPIRSTLNVETYAEMVEAMNRIRDEVQNAPQGLIVPQLIGIATKPNLLIDDLEDKDLDRAIVITYSLTGLAQKVNLREALHDWRGDPEYTDLIESIYSIFGGNRQSVPEHAARRAKDEVAQYRLGRDWPGPGLRIATRQ